MKVVIVGAGIGGLTTALRLHHVGIGCEVHEQGEQIRPLGVGINLLPPAVGELAALGLLDPLVEAGIRTAELFYTHRLGHEILRRPCGLDAGAPVPQLSFHRGRLQGVLLRAVLDRLGPGAVRTGRRLVGFEQDVDGVEARFVDRANDPLPPARGDVLVAADGIHSTVRAMMFPAEGPPRWNGVQMWRGVIEWPEFRTGRSVIIAGGTAAKLVLYPIARGRVPGTALTNWAICVRTGRDRDPLPHWTRDRVTLLGDAAHPMFPMGSNGAGQAVLDATSLAGHLAGSAHPADALLGYEADRLPVTGEIVLRNRAGGPESVIDEVERRAPDGFARLADVMDAAEIDAVVSGYTRASRPR